MKALPLWTHTLQSPATCVAVSWQDLLIWGLLFSFMFPPQLSQGQLAWHFCHVPKYSQSGTHSLEDRKTFTWWVQKHLKPTEGKSARKTPLTLDEATSFSELHLPSCGRRFLYVDPKCHTVRTGGCFPAFCVPIFNRTWKRTYWLAGARRWPLELTSSRHSNYFNLIWEIHRHTHTIAKECLGFSSQWNSYHLSGEWQVSGTPQPME
jgi:hypothetical protein